METITGHTHMTNLRKFCTLLILLSLIACDDKGAKSTTEVQNLSEFESIQSPTDIEQLKARLFDNPNDFNTLSHLGDLYFESSLYLEAIQTYDKALAVNPNSADCLNDKGLALYYSGEPDSALESFDKAIAIEPGYAHAWLSKGYVLVSEGRYQEAIVPLNKVKELDTTGNLTKDADNFLATIAEKGIE